MKVSVVGLSHKTAPVEVREVFSASTELLPAVLARLSSHPDLDEVMFLSTCNRVEVFASAASRADGSPIGPEDADIAVEEAVRGVLAEHAGVAPSDFGGYSYTRTGEEAVRHIFRVAASLDSMVVGEPQILGQVKDAYDLASKRGSLGGLLGRCLGRAFTVAKRVRTETSLGVGTVSISSVAVELARAIFGDLTNHSVLLVGAGEMAEAAAKSLGKSARSMRVCNRSFEKAVALATTFGGGAAPLDALEQELLLADVVVTSTGSRSFVVTRDMVKRAMKARKGRTLFFVDIAVPRNVDPEVHKIDNAYVYNVDDLERHVAEGMKSRTGEVAKAEAIVDEELLEFRRWSRALQVQPTVVALRAKTRAVLTSELERTLGSRLRHLGEGDRAALAQMIDSATNKLLHAPSTRIKQSVAEGEDRSAELVSSLRYLFDLPEPRPGDSLAPPPPSLPHPPVSVVDAIEPSDTDRASDPAPSASRVTH
jgi:glutamyl-tRNA reductase